MDPLTIASIALGLGATAWKGAQAAGLVGSPDWAKYVEAGLYISSAAIKIIEEVKSGSQNYDNLTADQIRALLTPKGWSELEMRAAAELATEG